MRSATLLAALCAAALAQTPQPQFVWEGEVDGTCVLHVRGNRVDVEDRMGSPVAKVRHRFFDSLPQLQQNVRMDVGQARGNVRILQQPVAANNFTLSILIEDRPAGASLYSLALYWSSGGRAAWNEWTGGAPRQRNLERGEERMTWTGRVDDEAVVECRGNQCRATQTRGLPVDRDRANFTRPLPAREVRVSLDDLQGRGEIRLIEQPHSGNGYTVRIGVLDRQGGAGDYAFSLYWREPRSSEPDRLFARLGARWSGRVDGKVRVQLQGTSGGAQTLTGVPVSEERLAFDRPMPASPMPNLAVKRLKGRGRVEIVEFPSAANGFRMTFEIDDSQGGADWYDVEIGW